jgi:hypothetical protein
VANVTRKAIEDAIIAALKAGLTTSFAVERYEGQSGSTEAMRQWIAEMPSLPAVAVFYAGSQNQTLDEEDLLLQANLTYSLWLIHDKTRGYEQALIDDDGVYEMLEEIETALNGKRVLPTIGKLLVTDDQMIGAETESGRTIWAIQVQVSNNKTYGA